MRVIRGVRSLLRCVGRLEHAVIAAFGRGFALFARVMKRMGC